MEPKMTPNSLTNLDKEEQSWRDHKADITILQGHRNENSLVLA